MTDRPLGAQISRMLADRGIDTVFGIPGVHNIELYRGIEQSGLTHVLARHEQSAGFMADGYARATGRPGVAFVITGPGLTNIMTSMGQAYSDSVPMLVISSCLNRADLGAGRGRLHEMKDQELAAQCVCEWSRTALDAATAYMLIDRALDEFETLRPRPRHIQIPIDVLEAPAPPPPPRAALSACQTGPFEAAIGSILDAVRPLFILGGGARHAAPQARAAMDSLGAACFLTYAACGLVPAGVPLNFGTYLARPGSAEVIASADLVVVLGSELSETDLWRDALGHAAPLIRVDIDPAEFSDTNAAQNVRCDAGRFLQALAQAAKDRDPAMGWTAQEVAQARARWRAEVEAERPGIVAICDALRDAMPADARIFSDMTQFAYVAKEIWDLPAPGLWHHPNGFGTLGYALPAAIGARAGLADAPVVAIAGDYGFQYTLQELGTAVELARPLPIMLWDNGMLKEIEASMAQAQIAPVAVKALNPDFSLLAAAYGLDYAKPGSLADLVTALGTALAAKGPVLIHMTPEVLQ